MGKYFTNDILYHHGIKGQHWGVKNGPPYPLQENTLNKSGSKTNTNNKTKTTKNKHKFEDRSASKSKRKDAVIAVLGSYGMVGLSTALNAATIVSGFVSLQGLLTEVGSVAMAAISTGNLIVGDVQNSKANKKEKKFLEERKQNPIDKVTGFHKKTKEMSMDEDMERINPAYKNWDSNTKHNCVLCTMAMELRRRGYDVQARKATKGYDGDTLAGDWFTGAKSKRSEGSMNDNEIIDRLTHGINPYIHKDAQKSMVQNTLSEIKNQKDGARGQITLIWNGTASGHSVFYANEGGKLVIYDTQANEKFTGDAAENYLYKCSQINVTRLDNHKINTKYIKEVAE